MITPTTKTFTNKTWRASKFLNHCGLGLFCLMSFVQFANGSLGSFELNTLKAKNLPAELLYWSIKKWLEKLIICNTNTSPFGLRREGNGLRHWISVCIDRLAWSSIEATIRFRHKVSDRYHEFISVLSSIRITVSNKYFHYRLHNYSKVEKAFDA